MLAPGAVADQPVHLEVAALVNPQHQVRDVVLERRSVELAAEPGTVLLDLQVDRGAIRHSRRTCRVRRRHSAGGPRRGRQFRLIDQAAMSWSRAWGGGDRRVFGGAAVGDRIHGPGQPNEHDQDRG